MREEREDKECRGEKREWNNDYFSIKIRDVKNIL